MVNINRLMLFIFLWKVPNELNIAFQFILILENYIQTDKLCHCIWNNFMALGKKVIIFIDVLVKNTAHVHQGYCTILESQGRLDKTMYGVACIRVVF